MRKIILLMALAVTASAFATGKPGDFYKEGIGYKITGDATCEVSGAEDNLKKTSLYIPAVVEWDGIDYTIEGIGDFAFSGFEGAEKIWLPMENTFKYIGNHAFNGCKKVKQLILPVNLISLGTAPFAFSSIEDLEVGTDARAQGKYPHNVFNDMEKLKVLTLWGPVVDSFEGTGFTGCKNLKHIIIKDEHNYIGCSDNNPNVKGVTLYVPDQMQAQYKGESTSSFGSGWPCKAVKDQYDYKP
ncbi:MAG: leucine-rich repeat domain-containing protein [Bacteroidales bacterium]|nr:leucine-rich repeat domain-containing protein [Bacteroidales bacterium]